ncbi:MAG TPA: hypothetical protein VHT03_06470 [Rhizomicrobium sp.]|jgi:hypothetical protein|nr:hypothetical protein [Rhizomicrobium sp.]
MGAARLLAKGWIVFALYTGALALGGAAGASHAAAAGTVVVCLLLFGAMGLLFISGYGLSAGHVHPPSPAEIKLQHLVPGFSELVFIAFALILLLVQLFYAPAYHEGPAVDGLERAMGVVVFGQRLLENALLQCHADGGRLFISALAWTLALIFLGSALSRLKLGATLVRFERKRRPEALGAQPLAFALGLVAVAGIQLLYMGTAYTLLPCRALAGLFGGAMLGIGPLMLAYLIVAALTNLLALGPET